MLEFFRKYQSYIYAVVTVVIVISFSFFGANNAMPTAGNQEQTAFTAIDGTSIKRHELDEMALFLGTDAEDKLLFGGISGPNFLNDGVIKKDFLESGLGAILITAYAPELEKDLQSRLDKERHYTPYAHPQAQFISMEGAWTYFAPEMKQKLAQLKKSQNAVSPDAINARIALFVGEKKIPAPMLREVLRYQQKQNSWITPDPTLDRNDLSLFGYHTIDDWFGPRFVRLVSEFVINASKIAEEKGYTVSKNEALADLMRNTEMSYRQNQQSPYLGVKSSNEYYNEQLQNLGMDQNRAIAVWRQVLLFRRLLDDVENSVLTDPLLQSKIFEYAKNSTEGDLYQLPKEFRFNDFRSLQKFEIYLDAISKRTNSSLLLPTTFLNLSEIKSKTPELVQKRYLIEVAQLKKSALNSKVGLKEIWNWEVDEKNWSKLQKEFPALGNKADKSREERLAALDGIDSLSRIRIDNMARNAIVDQHPEWLTQALKDAKSEKQAISVRTIGGKSLIAGLEDRKEFMNLLNSAALANEEKPAQESLEAAAKLSQYTADKNNYYRVVVIERSPNEEVMTFAEADREGVLDQLLDRKLDAYYKKIRDAYPDKFQAEDKTWKPYEDVRNSVAERYFEKLLKDLRSDYADTKGKEGQQPTTGNLAASIRFYAYVKDIQNKLKNGTETSDLLKPQQKDVGLFAERMALSDQWKLEKTHYQTTRGSKEDPFDHQALFALQENQWSEVGTPLNGDLYFFQLKAKGSAIDFDELNKKLAETHQLISNEASRVYMNSLVLLMKEQKAISLDYLDRQEPIIESD